MKVIDPGHKFQLDSLDGDFYQELRFVKREGEKFPGNIGSYSSTTLQEVIRALISRIEYLDGQISCWQNEQILEKLKKCLYLLEYRAAQRHNRTLSYKDEKNLVSGEGKCLICGHLGCKGHTNVST